MLVRSLITADANLVPVAETSGFVALGLVLAVAAGVTWRSYLMTWLIIHVVAVVAMMLLKPEPSLALMGVRFGGRVRISVDLAKLGPAVYSAALKEGMPSRADWQRMVRTEEATIQ